MIRTKKHMSLILKNLNIIKKSINKNLITLKMFILTIKLAEHKNFNKNKINNDYIFTSKFSI
jgi:hypothetical protein